MRVVMTGATGAIGRPLARALVERGYALTVLTRDPSRARTIVAGAHEYLRWEERDDRPWRASLAGADALIHLAGESLFEGRASAARVRRASEGKIASTRAFAEELVAMAAPPRIFVNASSQGFYGFAAADRDVVSDEESPAGRDDWGQGSQRWEEAARPVEARGVRLVLLRTGVFLGREAGPVVAQRAQFERGWGGWVRPGTQSFNWIHEDDAVGLILMALTDDRVRGPINLVAPGRVTHREYAETLGRVLGHAARRGLPAAALWLFMGKPAEIITRSHAVAPARALALGYTFRFPTLEPALRDLVGAR